MKRVVVPGLVLLVVIMVAPVEPVPGAGRAGKTVSADVLVKSTALLGLIVVSVSVAVTDRVGLNVDVALFEIGRAHV